MSHLLRAALVALALLTPNTATAAQLNCLDLVRSTVVTVTQLTTTSSTTPVNVVGAVTTQIFGNASCVVVEFSGHVRAPSPNGLRLSVSVTGSAAVTSPTSYSMTTTGTRLDGRTVVFAFPNLQCECTLRLQVQSINGSPVSIGQGVMRVYSNNEV